MIRGSRLRRTWMVLGLFAAALLVGGCNDELKTENAALYSENTELRDQLELPRSALEAAETDRGRLQDQVASLQSQLDEMQNRPAAGANTGFERIEGIEVESGAGGEVTVRVPGDILFASGKAELKSSAKKTLSDIAAVLKTKYGDQSVRVEGYTDSDPIKKSKWEDNLQLSAARAMAVHRYLQSLGVDKERLYSAGFGATHFRASNRTPQGKGQNRRVEIVVIMN